jgi:hypothetical protein
MEVASPDEAQGGLFIGGFLIGVHVVCRHALLYFLDSRVPYPLGTAPLEVRASLGSLAKKLGLRARPTCCSLVASCLLPSPTPVATALP